MTRKYVDDHGRKISFQEITKKEGKRLVNSEFRELSDEVLALLPEVPELDDEKYSK